MNTTDSSTDATKAEAGARRRTRAAGQEPWTSAHDHSTAASLASTEYERLADLLGELTGEEWHRQTECPGWDVRAMAGHCIGMAQMVTGVRAAIGQQARASLATRRSGRPLIDELTDLQVRDHADLADEEVAEAMRRTGRAAARARRSAPRALRALTFSDEGPAGKEKWRVGYLLDTILTRDPWTHRGDICRATGRPMTLTAEHDGRIVDDVVAEWSIRHGQPFELTLTGPAGGHWSVARPGGTGERIEMDALEFCRVLSGRAPGSGLLATAVPF